LVDRPSLIALGWLNAYVVHRFAIAIQNDIGNRHSSVTIIAAITSTVSPHPVTVPIVPSKTNGLSVPSMIHLGQIRSVDRERLVKRLGVVHSTTMRKVDNALRTVSAWWRFKNGAELEIPPGRINDDGGDLPAQTRLGSLTLWLVLTPRRPSHSLSGCHPSWRPSTAFAPASCNALKGYDRFFDLLALLAQFGQHFDDIH
jgi:mRNA-degrading endonuclease toxin of MazEF toxin-antitoxin module